METIIFNIEYNDGRTFRVFCANSTQKRKILIHCDKNKDKIKDLNVITNGIHTVKEYFKINS